MRARECSSAKEPLAAAGVAQRENLFKLCTAPYARALHSLIFITLAPVAEREHEAVIIWLCATPNKEQVQGSHLLALGTVCLLGGTWFSSSRSLWHSCFWSPTSTLSADLLITTRARCFEIQQFWIIPSKKRRRSDGIEENIQLLTMFGFFPHEESGVENKHANWTLWTFFLFETQNMNMLIYDRKKI